MQEVWVPFLVRLLPYAVGMAKTQTISCLRSHSWRLGLDHSDSSSLPFECNLSQATGLLNYVDLIGNEKRDESTYPLQRYFFEHVKECSPLTPRPLLSLLGMIMNAQCALALYKRSEDGGWGLEIIVSSILFSLLLPILWLNPPLEDEQTEAQSGSVPYPHSRELALE